VMWLPVHYTIASLAVGAAASAASPKKACGPITLSANLAALLFNLLTVRVWLGGLATPILFGVPVILDPLSCVALVLVSTLASVCAAYSVFKIGAEDPHVRTYYVLYNLLIISLSMVTMVRNALLLYVFFELITFAAILLVGHRRDPKALEASVKYLFVCVASSALSLIGFAVLLSRVHVLDLLTLGQALSESHLSPLDAKLCLYSLLLGFGVKAGLVGLHFFIPDAYGEAPPPISALMHITLPGNYSIIRILTALQPLIPPKDQLIISLAGILTVYTGALMTLASKDVKRMVACVSIEGGGYIILSSSLGTPYSIAAASLCLVNFSLIESALFLAVGAVHSKTGTRLVDQLGGLFKAMPVTAWLFIASALAISGVPPFGGFTAKLSVYMACVKAGKMWASLAAASGSGILLTAVIWTAHRMFFGPPREVERLREPKALLVPVVILFLLFTLLGLYPAPLLRLFGGV